MAPPPNDVLVAKSAFARKRVNHLFTEFTIKFRYAGIAVYLLSLCIINQLFTTVLYGSQAAAEILALPFSYLV